MYVQYIPYSLFVLEVLCMFVFNRYALPQVCMFVFRQLDMSFPLKDNVFPLLLSSYQSMKLDMCRHDGFE